MDGECGFGAFGGDGCGVDSGCTPRFPDTPLVPAVVERVVDGDTIIVWMGDGAGAVSAGADAGLRAASAAGGGGSAARGKRPGGLSRTADVAGGIRARVRLIGLDAAESVAPEEWRNTAEGAAASAAVHALVPAGSRVWLQRDVSDSDEYGRLLRYVWLRRPDEPGETGDVRAHMLNAILVERGIARARSYPPDDSLDLLFSSLQG